MTREFSIVRELSRREIERHQRRFIGITITEPRWEMQDDNGAMEWVADIRVGVEEGWAVIKNCLISQWALGAVTDLSVPVLCERSEAGRVTIIARSEVNLPELRLDAYSYDELGFPFMRNLEVRSDGAVVDGFGYEIRPPGSVNPGDFLIDPDEEDDIEPPPLVEDDVGRKNHRPRFVNELVEWGSSDFVYGETPLKYRRQGWVGV